MSRATRYIAKDLSKPKEKAVTLDIESLGDDRYSVLIDGQRIEVESQPLPGLGMTLRQGSSTFVAEFEEKADEIAVLLCGQVNRFDLVDERQSILRAANAVFEVEGRQTINSPMPGKVVKVFVKAGDVVTEGQGLVVVEAMKMENELKSPKAGTVLEVVAKEGQAVENGAKLVVVE